MKRIISLIFACTFLTFFCADVHAVDTQIFSEYTDSLETLVEKMPSELKEKYTGIFETPDGVEKIRKSISFSSFADFLFNSLEEAWPSILRLFFSLATLTLCAGIFHNFNTSLTSPALSGAVSFCITLAFVILMTGSVDTLLTNALLYLENLTNFSSAMVPITVSVTAASGKLTAATVSHASLMLLFTLIQNIGTTILSPVVRTSYCLGIAGAVGGMVRLDSVSKCIRKVFTIVLTFLSLSLGFIIGTQNILARSADTFSLKTVKFALGNIIPIIGGAMSDAVSTVTTSFAVIRSAAGGMCVLAIVVFLLPILVQLVLHRLLFSALKGAAEMMGCDREAKVMEEVHGTIGYILAVVSLVSLLFLFIISLFTLLGEASV